MSDTRAIVWRDRVRQNGNIPNSMSDGRPSLESADETLDESSQMIYYRIKTLIFFLFQCMNI